MAITEQIRDSVIAGTWYPDDPQTLKQEIARFLDQAQPPALEGELKGLIVPHAGYLYSGGVAAYAYKLLEARPFDRVLILAPSHRAYFKGASVYSKGGFRTPLGVAPLDQELVDAFLQHKGLVHDLPQAHAQEHSLEIQLPFLQVVLSDFRLTPLVMGDQSFDYCQKLAKVIAEICRGKNVLLIASSDLSHYHPYREAKRLDQIVLDRVKSFDPPGLSQELRKGDCEACGAGPIMTIMLAAQQLGAHHAKVLHYANSGDVTGDKSGVVGYMAAALYSNTDQTVDKPSHDAASNKVGVDMGLSADEKRTLLDIAQQAIRSQCVGQSMPDLPIEASRLKEVRGAFVTLHKRGELRGCIGMIEGRRPLHETIRSMAVQAAFADPRFCPLNPSELETIDIEISVLTPLQRLEDPSQIEIGKHGLLIVRDHHSGLLLPQVATEHGWDRTQFLEWTCRKAGLPLDAWQDPSAELYIFSADIFSAESLQLTE